MMRVWLLIEDWMVSSVMTLNEARAGSLVSKFKTIAVEVTWSGIVPG